MKKLTKEEKRSLEIEAQAIALATQFKVQIQAKIKDLALTEEETEELWTNLYEYLGFSEHN